MFEVSDRPDKKHFKGSIPKILRSFTFTFTFLQFFVFQCSIDRIFLLRNISPHVKSYNQVEITYTIITAMHHSIKGILFCILDKIYIKKDKTKRFPCLDIFFYELDRWIKRSLPRFFFVPYYFF